MNALDGRCLATITDHTAPLSLIISGNHREHLQLYIISSPSSPVVLGLPWFRLHNFQIDWCSAPISSWSVFCHFHCLHSATTTVKPPVSIAPPSPDLSLVPPAYHDFATVFSKERVLSLPPHCLCDCAIDLLPGAPLPSSRLYNLSCPERESVEEYINIAQASDLIRPSSSPLGAGFFFVGKKDGSLCPRIDYRGLNHIFTYEMHITWSASKRSTNGRLPLTPPWGTLSTK